MLPHVYVAFWSKGKEGSLISIQISQSLGPLERVLATPLEAPLAVFRQSFQQLYRIDTVTDPISQVKQLRLRKFNTLPPKTIEQNAGLGPGFKGPQTPCF